MYSSQPSPSVGAAASSSPQNGGPGLTHGNPVEDITDDEMDEGPNKLQLQKEQELQGHVSDFTDSESDMGRGDDKRRAGLNTAAAAERPGSKRPRPDSGSSSKAAKKAAPSGSASSELSSIEPAARRRPPLPSSSSAQPAAPGSAGAHQQQQTDDNAAAAKRSHRRTSAPSRNLVYDADESPAAVKMVAAQSGGAVGTTTSTSSSATAAIASILAPYELNAAGKAPMCTGCGSREGGKMAPCGTCFRQYHPKCTPDLKGWSAYTYICPVCKSFGADFEDTGVSSSSSSSKSGGKKAGSAAGAQPQQPLQPLISAADVASVAASARSQLSNALFKAGLDGPATVVVNSRAATISTAIAMLSAGSSTQAPPAGEPVVFHLALEPPLLPQPQSVPAAVAAAAAAAAAGNSTQLSESDAVDSPTTIFYAQKRVPRTIVSDRLWTGQLQRALASGSDSSSDAGGSTEHSVPSWTSVILASQPQQQASSSGSSESAVSTQGGSPSASPSSWLLNRILTSPELAQVNGLLGSGKGTKGRTGQLHVQGSDGLLSPGGGGATSANSSDSGSLQLSNPLFNLSLSKRPASTASASGAVQPAAVDTALLSDLLGPSSLLLPPVLRQAVTLPAVSEDGNEETCAVCGVGGDIICCDSCSASHHVDCEQELRTTGIPEADVRCGMCHLRMRAACELVGAQEAAAAALQRAASEPPASLTSASASASQPPQLSDVITALAPIVSRPLIRLALARCAWVASSAVDESGARLCGPLVYLPPKEHETGYYASCRPASSSGSGGGGGGSKGSGSSSSGASGSSSSSSSSSSSGKGATLLGAGTHFLCLAVVMDRLVSRVYEKGLPTTETAHSSSSKPGSSHAAPSSAEPSSAASEEGSAAVHSSSLRNPSAGDSESSSLSRALLPTDAAASGVVTSTGPTSTSSIGPAGFLRDITRMCAETIRCFAPLMPGEGSSRSSAESAAKSGSKAGKGASSPTAATAASDSSLSEQDPLNPQSAVARDSARNRRIHCALLLLKAVTVAYQAALSEAASTFLGLALAVHSRFLQQQQRGASLASPLPAVSVASAMHMATASAGFADALKALCTSCEELMVQAADGAKEAASASKRAAKAAAEAATREATASADAGGEGDVDMSSGKGGGGAGGRKSVGAPASSSSSSAASAGPEDSDGPAFIKLFPSKPTGSAIIPLPRPALIPSDLVSGSAEAHSAGRKRKSGGAANVYLRRSRVWLRCESVDLIAPSASVIRTQYAGTDVALPSEPSSSDAAAEDRKDNDDDDAVEGLLGLSDIDEDEELEATAGGDDSILAHLAGISLKRQLTPQEKIEQKRARDRDYRRKKALAEKARASSKSGGDAAFADGDGSGGGGTGNSGSSATSSGPVSDLNPTETAALTAVRASENAAKAAEDAEETLAALTAGNKEGDTDRARVSTHPSEYDWLYAALLRDSGVSLDAARSVSAKARRLLGLALGSSGVSGSQLAEQLLGGAQPQLSLSTSASSESAVSDAASAQPTSAAAPLQPSTDVTTTAAKTSDRPSQVREAIASAIGAAGLGAVGPASSGIDDAILSLLFPGGVAATLGPHVVPGVGISRLAPDSSGDIRILPLAPADVAVAPSTIQQADPEDAVESALHTALHTAPGMLIDGVPTAIEPPPGGVVSSSSKPQTLPKVVNALSSYAPALATSAASTGGISDRSSTCSGIGPLASLLPEAVGSFVGDPTRCDGCRYGWNHICAYADVTCAVLMDGSVLPPYLWPQQQRDSAQAESAAPEATITSSAAPVSSGAEAGASSSSLPVSDGSGSSNTANSTDLAAEGGISIAAAGGSTIVTGPALVAPGFANASPAAGVAAAIAAHTSSAAAGPSISPVHAVLLAARRLNLPSASSSADAVAVSGSRNEELTSAVLSLGVPQARAALLRVLAMSDHAVLKAVPAAVTSVVAASSAGGSTLVPGNGGAAAAAAKEAPKAPIPSVVSRALNLSILPPVVAAEVAASAAAASSVAASDESAASSSAGSGARGSYVSSAAAAAAAQGSLPSATDEALVDALMPAVLTDSLIASHALLHAARDGDLVAMLKHSGLIGPSSAVAAGSAAALNGALPAAGAASASGGTTVAAPGAGSSDNAARAFAGDGAAETTAADQDEAPPAAPTASSACLSASSSASPASSQPSTSMPRPDFSWLITGILDALDKPVPAALMPYVDITSESQAGTGGAGGNSSGKGGKSSSAASEVEPVTLRRALHLVPGNEDAFFTYLAVLQASHEAAAAAAAAAATAATSPSGPLDATLAAAQQQQQHSPLDVTSAQALLYGALRHWTAKVTQTRQGDAAAAKATPATSTASNAEPNGSGMLVEDGGDDDVSGAPVDDDDDVCDFTPSACGRLEPYGHWKRDRAIHRSRRAALANGTASTSNLVAPPFLADAAAAGVAAGNNAQPCDPSSTSSARRPPHPTAAVAVGAAEPPAPPGLSLGPLVPSLSGRPTPHKQPGWGMTSSAALAERSRHNTAKLILGRSRIDGTGLFAADDIEQDDVIAEYTGELVDDAVCDAREKYYESKGIADYMFRLGPNEIVDATIRGCRARYINHCCDPNCFAVITLPDESAAGAAQLASSSSSSSAGSSCSSSKTPSTGGGDGAAGGAEGSPFASLDLGAIAPGLQPPGAALGRNGTGTGRKVYLYTLRKIFKGEELTYDYQFPADEKPVPCRCGAANCRGTINKH